MSDGAAVATARRSVGSHDDALSPAERSRQMTIYDCISIAEKECLEPPCDDLTACDFAGECLRHHQPADEVHIPRLLSSIFGISTSEARRHLAQGAVFVDDQVVSCLDVPNYELAGRQLRIGRRRVVTLRS